MLIKANPTPFPTAKNGQGWDYPMPSEDVGISYQEYEGKAPDKGWWVNTVCWEAYMIIAGTATIYLDTDIYEVKPKDVVVMLPGQKVRFDHARGLKIITITKPNFFESQARIVEE